MLFIKLSCDHDALEKVTPMVSRQDDEGHQEVAVATDSLQQHRNVRMTDRKLPARRDTRAM